MPTKLPDWLQEAFRIVGGQAWPEGDEDGLNRIADAWQKMASEIEILGEFVRASAADVSRDMRGEFANAYRNYAETKGVESLAELKKNAQERSDQARNAAADIQSAKVAIIVQLGFVAAAIATAFIPIVGGAVSAGIVATVRLAISQIIKNVLWNITKHVATNIVIGEAIVLGTEVGTQGFQLATGQRTEWNDDRIKGAAISGAFGGVGGGLATSAAQGLGRAMARGALGEAAKKGLGTAAGQAAGAVANAGMQGAAGYAGEKAAGAVQGHDQTNSYAFTSAMAGGFGRLGGGKSTSHRALTPEEAAASAAAVDKAADSTFVDTPKTESLGPVTTAAAKALQTESLGSTDKSGLGSATSETAAGQGLPAYTKQDATLPGYSETGGEGGAANNAGAAAAATIAAGHAATTSQQSGVSGTAGQHSATSSGNAAAGQAAAKQEQGTTTGQQQGPTTSSGMATDKSPSVSTVSDGTSQATSTGAGTQAGSLQTTSTGQDHQSASEHAQTHQEPATTQHQQVGQQEVVEHQGAGQQQEVAAHHGAGQSQEAGQQEVASSHQEAAQVGEQQEAVLHQGAGQDQEAGQQQPVATHPEADQHQEASAKNQQAESQHGVGAEHRDGSPQHQVTNPVEQHNGAAKQDTAYTTEHEVESHAAHGESDKSQHETAVHSTETTAAKQETNGNLATKPTDQTSSNTSSAHSESSTETASSHATQTPTTSESTHKAGTIPSTAQHETVAPSLDSTPKQETGSTQSEHSSEQANTTQQTTPPPMMMPPQTQPTAHHTTVDQPQSTAQRGPIPTTSPTPVTQSPTTTSSGASHAASQGNSHTPATESRPTTSTTQGKRAAATAAATTGDARPPQRPENKASGPLSERAKGKRPMRSTQSSSDNVAAGKPKPGPAGTDATSRSGVSDQAKQKAHELARKKNLHYGGLDRQKIAEHERNLDELAALYEHGDGKAAEEFVNELRGPKDNPNPLYKDWATKGRLYGGAPGGQQQSHLHKGVPPVLEEAGSSGSHDTTETLVSGSQAGPSNPVTRSTSDTAHQPDHVTIEMGSGDIELQELHHDAPPPASPTTQHKQDLVATNLVKATDVDGTKLRADLAGAMTELGIDESVQNGFQAAFSDVQLKDDFTTLSEEGVTKSIGHGAGSVEVTVRTRLVGDESPVAGPVIDEPKHKVENASGDYGKTSDENASTVRREKGAELTGMFGLGTTIPMGSAVEANATVKASAVPGWKFGTESELQHSSKVELPGATGSTRHDLWHEITVTRHDGASATRHGTQESGIEVTIPATLQSGTDTIPVTDTRVPHPQQMYSAHLRGDNGLFDKITKTLPANQPLRLELDAVGSTARGQLREMVSGSDLSLRAGDLLGGREITKTLEYQHHGRTRTATVHIGTSVHSPTLIHEQDATVTDSGGAKTEHAASELTKQSTDVRFGGGGLVAIPRPQDASFAAGARGDVNVQAKVGGAGSDEHTMKNTTGSALESEHTSTGQLRAYRTTLDYDVRIVFDDGNSIDVEPHHVEAGATVWMSPEAAVSNGWDSASQQLESSGSTPVQSDTATPLSGISPLSVLGGKVEFGGVDRVATELHQILDGDVLPPHHGAGHQAPHVSKNVDRINTLITPDSFAAHAAELVGDGWSFLMPRDTHVGTSTGTEHVWVKIRATPGRYEATPVAVPGDGELKGTLTASSHDEHTTKTKGNWIATGGFGGVIPTDPNFPLRTAQFSGSYTRKIGDFERTVTVTAGHQSASSWKTGTHYQNTQRIHYTIDVFGPNGSIGERSFSADATAEVPAGSHPVGGQAGETPPASTAEFRDHRSSTPSRPGGWKQAKLPDDYAVHSLNLPHGMGEKLMLEIKAYDGLGDDAAASNPLGHLGKDGVIAANRVHNFAGPTEIGANLDRAVTGTYHAQVERYRQGELLTGYSDSLGEAAMHLSLSNPKVIDHAESLGLELTTKSKGSTGHGEITKASSETSLDGRTNARLNQQGTMVPQGTHTTTDESGSGTTHTHENESSQKRAYKGPGYLVSFDASLVLSGRNTEHLVIPVGDIYSKSEWTHSQVDTHDAVLLWVPAGQIHQIAGPSDIEWHVDHPHDEATTHYEGGQFAEPDHAKLADGWVNVRPEVTHNLLSHLEDALGSVTRDQLPDSVCASYVKWLYHSVTHMASSAYSWLMDPSAGRLDAMVHSRLFPALAPSGLGALYSDIVGGGIRTTYHYDGPLGRTDITITVKGTEKPGRVEAVSDKWTLSEESKTTSKLAEQHMTATTHTVQGQAVFSVFPEGQIQKNPGTAGAGEGSHKSQNTIEDTKSIETTYKSEHTGRTVAFVHDLDLTISIEKTSGWGRLPQSLSFGVLDRFFPATTSEPVNVHASIKDAVRRLVPEADAQPLEQLQNSATSGVDWTAPKHELPEGSRGTVRVDRVRSEIDSLLDGGLNAVTEGRPAPSLPAGATGTRHLISAMTTQSALSSQFKSAMGEHGYRIGGLDEDRYFEAGTLNHGPIKSLTLNAELRNPRVTAVSVEGTSFEGKQTGSETLKVTHEKTLAGGTSARAGLGGLLWNSNPSGPGPGQIGRLASEVSIKGPAAEKVVTDTSEVGGKTFEQEHSSSGKTYLVSSDVSWSITPEYRGTNVPGHWNEPRVVREPGGAVFRTDEAGLRLLGLEPPDDQPHSPAHEETTPEDHSGTEQVPVEQEDLVAESTAHQQQHAAESSSAAVKSESMSDFLAPKRESGGSTGGHGPEQPMSDKRRGKLPSNQVYGGDGHGVDDGAASGSEGHGSESSQHSEHEDAAHSTDSGLDHESQQQVDQKPDLDADGSEPSDVQSVPESQHQGVNWDLIVDEDREREFVLTEPGTPLWRALNDDPAEVLQHGLRPKDINDIRSLEFHVTTTGLDQFVATTNDPNYRHNQRRYTYEIVSSEPGIDVLATFKKWGLRHPYPWEREIAFPGVIPVKDITKIVDNETGEVIYRAPEPSVDVEQPNLDSQNDGAKKSVVDDAQSSVDHSDSVKLADEDTDAQIGNVVDAEAQTIVESAVRAYVDELPRADAVYMVDHSQLPQWVSRLADALGRGDQAAADGIRRELHDSLRGRRAAATTQQHENGVSGLRGGAPAHVPGGAGPSGSQNTATTEAGSGSGAGIESSSDAAFGAMEHTETVPGTDHTMTTPLDGSRAGEYVLRDGSGNVLEQRFNLFDQGENIGFVVVDHRGEQPAAHFFAEEDGDPFELEYSEKADGATHIFRLTDLDTGDFHEYDQQTGAVVRQSFGIGGQDRFGRVWHEIGTGRVLVTDGVGRAHFGSAAHDDKGLLHITLPDGTFVVDPTDGAVVKKHVNPAVYLGHIHEVPTPHEAFDHDVDYAPAVRWLDGETDDDGRLKQLSEDRRWWRLLDSEGNVTITQAVRPGEQSQLVGKLTREVKAWRADGTPLVVDPRYQWYRVDLDSTEQPRGVWLGHTDVGEVIPVEAHEPAANPDFDPLKAAVHRPTGLSWMIPAPLWRVDTDLLHRFDSRPVEEVFEPGFEPRDPSADLDLVTFSHYQNVESMYVSTTRSPGMPDDGLMRYEVDAPGGVDVNRTLGPAGRYPAEREILFPGGVKRQYIMGAEDPGEPDWYLINQHYDPLLTATPGKASDVDSLSGLTRDLTLGDEESRPSTGIEAWEQYVRARAEVDRWTKDSAWQEVGESSSGSVAKQRAQQELDAARARLHEAEQNLRSMGVEHPDATLAEQRARQAEERAGRDAAGHPGGGASWLTPDQRFHVQTDENTGTTLTTTLHGRQAGEFALRDADGVVVQQRMNLLGSSQESLGHVMLDRRPGMNEATHYLPDGTTRSMRWEPVSEREFQLVEPSSGDYLRFDAPTRTLVEQRSGTFVSGFVETSTGLDVSLDVLPESAFGWVSWQEPSTLLDQWVVRTSADGSLTELLHRDGMYWVESSDSGAVLATGVHDGVLTGQLLGQVESSLPTVPDLAWQQDVVPVAEPSVPVAEPGVPVVHGGSGGSGALRDWVRSANWGDLAQELKSSEEIRTDVLGDPAARRELAEQLKKAYESSVKTVEKKFASQKKLADATGYSEGKVVSLLKEAGTAMRAPSGRQAPRPVAGLAEWVKTTSWVDFVQELKSSEEIRTDVLGDPAARRELAEQLKKAYESSVKTVEKKFASPQKLADATGYSHGLVLDLLKEVDTSMRRSTRPRPELAEWVKTTNWEDLGQKLKNSDRLRRSVTSDPRAHRELVNHVKKAKESDSRLTTRKLAAEIGCSRETARKLLGEARKRSQEGVADQ
ncbi:scabin-related ADP-ribosyltransferase [Saccharopolyspora sp. NPDC002376]